MDVFRSYLWTSRRSLRGLTAAVFLLFNLDGCLWFANSEEGSGIAREVYYVMTFDCDFPIPMDYSLAINYGAHGDGANVDFSKDPKLGFGLIRMTRASDAPLSSAVGENIYLVSERTREDLKISFYDVGPGFFGPQDTDVNRYAVISDGDVTVTIVGDDLVSVDWMVNSCLSSRSH